MFVKIIRKTPQGKTESIHECETVEIHETATGLMFSAISPGHISEDIPTHDLKEGVSYSVYLMNQFGQTVDSYHFGVDEK